jgi:cellulose synthase operon protein C
MTVRWKPLILLSVLFLIVGVMGVIAITAALLPGRSSDLRALARAEWKAKRFEKAQIQFKRALQVDPKNAELHEELARMYSEWGEVFPAERPKLRAVRIHELSEATRHDKRAVTPRKQLLVEALDADDLEQAAHWARELLGIKPKDADANFALVQDALSSEPAKVVEARASVEALEAAEPDSVRTVWARAELANQSGDQATLGNVLERARSRSLNNAARIVDRMTRLRLLLLDVQSTTDVDTLPSRISAFRDLARGLCDEAELSGSRITRIGRMLESVQKHVAAVSSRDAASQESLASLTPSLEQLTEAIYKKSVDSSATPDLRVYLAYAENLLFRRKRDQCLQLVDRGLKSPVSGLPAWLDTVMQLREVGVKAALVDPSDPKRHEKATLYIKGLIDGQSARFQALGHLFQGVIDLERSGLATEMSSGGTVGDLGKEDPKFRASALTHLRKAAEGLSDVATANALYGVTLLLSQEPALGRQYLQLALRMGNLEPRYQIWAAWSMLQAGYPEEAQPIVDGMLAAVAQGKLDKDLAGSLHLLKGQIHQARRGPGDLNVARAEYEAALHGGQPNTAALQLRMAQLDVGLGKTADGERRIEAIKSDATGGPAAEQLSVLLMKEQGKIEAARKALETARARYPHSDDLVALDAALRVEAKQFEDADRVLAEFVVKHPTHHEIALLRVRLLAGQLKQPDAARKILVELCEKTETSTPFVQLALLDLNERKYDAVSTTITKIRSRWKESSAGDLLEAQLCLARDQPRDAVKFLNEALKKDPNNKLALFWKAQLEDKVGAAADATKIYEEIAREHPVKEIDQGLTLATAAQWALATQALENQDFDGAINRFADILKSGEANSDLTRSARWRLVQAHAAKGEWKTAKLEMDSLLKDPSVNPIERVRAANLFRLGNDYKSAREQLNIVLRDDPVNSQAAAVAAYLLADEKRPVEAAKVLRTAITKSKEADSAPQPPSIYLMLAAIENLSPPQTDSLQRALAVVDEGIKAHPDSVEMVRAKSRVTRLASKDPERAIAVVEERAKSDSKDNRFHRLLVDVYREENRLPKAEAVVRGLLKDSPDDALLMTALVRIVASQAIEAAGRGDRVREKAFNDDTSRLLAAFRAKKPKEILLAEAECDLAGRRGDLPRAIAITQEIDQIDPNSAVGPLLRAKIEAVRGNPEAVASAYEDAATRAPRRIDIRMAFGQASLSVGKTDLALKQAAYVLDADQTRIDAILLKARALALQGGTQEQVAQRSEQAIAELKAALSKKPATPLPIYHLLAEIQYRTGKRAQAIATLKEAMKGAPADENAAAMLVQIWTEPRQGGKPAPLNDVREASAFANEVGGSDTKGNVCLALAVGYHKAGHVDFALAWAEKAAAKLDLPVVHLNFGDILLAKAESMTEPESAKEVFKKAAAQYDLVLKVQSNSIEAVNNKAWILHRYLNRNDEALRLIESLAKRADSALLPAEFLDTFGAILEEERRSGDAEQAYQKGLRKAPDHPVLNYHMGRLLARDSSRKDQATRYLEKALAAPDRLGRAMAGDAEGLLKSLGN